MRLDLLIASASAGLLVYSAWLLIPTARLRPEDIVSDAYIPESGYTLGPEDVPWPVFPEDTTILRIRDALEGKTGFRLLVLGTLGGVLAIIAGTFTVSRDGLSSLDTVEAAAAFGLGLIGGWLWTPRAERRWKLETHLLGRCFLAWLEKAVVDPKSEGGDFDLAIISTARHSGCSLMGNLAAPMGTVLTDEDEKAIPLHIVTLARKCGYRWRRDDLRNWAGEVIRADRSLDKRGL